jgi:protein-arginine kinase activator protein McsA
MADDDCVPIDVGALRKRIEEDKRFDRLIEESSLGTPAAKRARAAYEPIKIAQQAIDEAAAYEEEHSITCPQCGMTSHNPNDVRARYCGNCHQYHDTMNLGGTEPL